MFSMNFFWPTMQPTIQHVWSKKLYLFDPQSIANILSSWLLLDKVVYFSWRASENIPKMRSFYDQLRVMMTNYTNSLPEGKCEITLHRQSRTSSRFFASFFDSFVVIENWNWIIIQHIMQQLDTIFSRESEILMGVAFTFMSFTGKS